MSGRDRPPEDDVEVFRRAVRKVRRLPLEKRSPPPWPGPRARPEPAPSPAAPPGDDKVAPERRARGRADAGPDEARVPPIGGGDVLSFARAGVQGRVRRRLRRGQVPVESVLDLHALDADRARAALQEFIDASRSAGRRCVCVIHGKGHRSADGRPVLKSAVDGWLRGHDAVAAFCSARPEDGGTGALYVLIRR